MNLCIKIPNQFLFQKIEGWALIQGVGAYSKGRLLVIPVSRMAAYSRGTLKSITVLNPSSTIECLNKRGILFNFPIPQVRKFL